MANSKSMKMYEELCDLLEDELNSITKKGEINKENLEFVEKLTHSIKSIKTTMAMLKAEEEGGSGGNSFGGSYGSYDMSMGGNSNRGSYGSYGNSNYSRGSYDGMSNQGGMSNGMSNQGGNSNRGSYDSYDSYDSYEGGSNDYSQDSYDGRRGRDNDNDGRYSERRGGGRGRGRSRDAAKDKMIEKLEYMKDDAMNKQDKEAIQRLIQELQN